MNELQAINSDLLSSSAASVTIKTMRRVDLGRMSADPGAMGLVRDIPNFLNPRKLIDSDLIGIDRLVDNKRYPVVAELLKYTNQHLAVKRLKSEDETAYSSILDEVNSFSNQRSGSSKVLPAIFLALASTFVFFQLAKARPYAILRLSLAFLVFAAAFFVVRNVGLVEVFAFIFGSSDPRHMFGRP